MRICLAVLLCTLSLFSAAASLSPTQQIGQKLIIDLRYFCTDNTSSARCRTPFTAITKQNRSAITALLTRHAIGGVILFSENITSAAQLITLNYELQMIMKQAGLPPLFIAIDQEGGRVARLPDAMAVRFSGNMAIGATFATSGTRFSRDVAKGMADTLTRLGINVNFAPSLDVNVNPDNPVINVRSYGDDPARVASLGEAAVRGLQQHGVVSAVKHFPGHGDTHIDSHSGLPRVNHDIDAIRQQDLLPFTRVIRDASPGMVMTAHIQYPALDNSTVAGRDGKQMIVPATMSKHILTDLLRGQLGFDGLIVSDAMDMAGIAAYFTPDQALKTAFEAGVDIALMPYPVRTAGDVDKFTALLENLVDAAYQNAAGERALAASLRRIAQTKKVFAVGDFTSSSLAARLSKAVGVLPLRSNQALERELSARSVTWVTPKTPLLLAKDSRWLFVMPDAAHCDAAQHSARSKGVQQLACLSYFALPEEKRAFAALARADNVIIGDISPQHAMYETGGLDPDVPRADFTAQQSWLREVMAQAKRAGKTVVFTAMRAPYSITRAAPLADMTLATYYYNVAVSGETAHSVMFDSLTDVLLGNQAASGSLPVSVPLTEAH